MQKLPLALLIAFTPLLPCAVGAPAPNGRAEHIVVVVWDGMRPDFITPQYCPTLYGLATNGTFFRRHHPVFVSSTEVNGAALATGANPGRNGIQANTDYRLELSFLSSFGTEGLDAVRRGDLLTGGRYLLTPTLAETLQQAGMPTVTAGGKPVALFHDRSPRKESEAAKRSVTLFEGKTIPREVAERLAKVNEDKGFPAAAIPNTGQDQWTTRSLVRSLWKDGVPKYSLLWLSDPDKSQHDAGVGSANALAGIESSDKNLAEVIKALRDKGVYDKTDIFIVSDHGFSTITAGPDIAAILKKQKFEGGGRLEDPKAGDVMVIGLGGAALFYVVEHEEAVCRRLVEFLQTADFTGVIFSRRPMEGTFPLESVGYSSESPNAPDVMISLRWTADRNEYGAPGSLISAGGTRGKGSHASLSRYDMNNTLVASGPDIKKGLISDVPSGNIDLAPTVLWLCGVEPLQSMDGRILHEALVPSKAPAPKVSDKKLEAVRDLGLFRWSQYLKVSEVNGTAYFDEGNGSALPK
ncbi:MAG TPA: alkaline phosphatase family protein [Chthoniobacteraceae bacterium]|nr:alkaline phosphatase family protein [Chthoniobacteraceae bacterium]